jgi:hypothetical protein
MYDTATPTYPQAGGKLPSESDGFAIASLVTAFFVPVLGVIFGHLSNHRAKVAHRGRSGLAVAGLVLGYLFTAITALIIVIVIAVAASTTPSVSAGAAPPASSSAAQAGANAPSTTSLSPGQPLTVNDTFDGYHGTVTITSAKVVTGAQSEYGSAPAHGHFVILTVTATAANGGQLDMNPLDFYAKAGGQHISTDDGNALDATNVSQDLTASTLNSGETATGQIAFDVPSAHGQIVYAPGWNSQALASWNY